MPKVFEFPKWLQRTPEELAEEQKTQELRRAALGRGHHTPEELVISRGVLLEETARGNLQAAAETKGEEARRQEREELKNLAVSYEMQGRFEEAKETHPFKRMQKYYQSIIDAIEKDDDERCGCPDIEGKTQGVEVKITPRFTRKEIFSQKHGKVVGLIECQLCGSLNARPAANRLLVSQATKAQNIAAARGQGRGLINDAQVLRVKSG